MSKFFRWFNKDKKPDTPEIEEQSSQDEQDNQHSQRAEDDPVGSTPSDEALHEVDTSADVEIEQTADHTPVAEEEPVTEEKPEPAEVSSDTVQPAATGAPAEEVAIDDNVAAEVSEADQQPEPAPAQEPEKEGFFTRLKRGLSRTKENLGTGLASLFTGKHIDDELFEELETQLLVADVGMDTTNRIIERLTESANRKQLKDGDALFSILREQMGEMLAAVEKPLEPKAEKGPFVILMVGVNGVGKTTTIGKLAKQFQQQGKKVMLAAGDTFRAAAVEQLQVWGERNQIPVVAQQTGSDSASVIFDALQSAQAKGVDVLIADTAGRLQNKDHLMEELKKVVRVMKKINPDAPHEIMLTLDAATGQNAVSQAKLFNDAVGLTGITLTKLDGTAKGGVIFAIADKFGIPIRYIGVGEGIDDLRPFESHQFVNALFSDSGSDKG